MMTFKCETEPVPSSKLSYKEDTIVMNYGTKMLIAQKRRMSYEISWLFVIFLDICVDL